MEGMLQSSVLYVIKLGFEMVNAKFFRIVEGNALRVHCNKIANLIAYTRFDGAGF